MLGVHVSFNKKLHDDINFYTAVTNIYNVIKLWHMRHLSVEVKITTYKSLAISKIVHLVLLTIVPKNIIEELNEIQKRFLRSNKKCKIKHCTVGNGCKNGFWKNPGIILKSVSLKFTDCVKNVIMTGK